MIDKEKTYLCLGTRVYVFMEPKHREHVHGLCGNWNNRTEDDIMDRNGVRDAINFGDSWRTDTSCAEVDLHAESFDPCNAHVSCF